MDAAAAAENGIQVSVLTNTGTASIRRGLTDLPRYRITMDTKLSDILPANPNARTILPCGRTCRP
ncbi:MAG: hypothetical protein ACLSF2_05645 [Butyricicoccus sp.]